MTGCDAGRGGHCAPQPALWKVAAVCLAFLIGATIGAVTSHPPAYVQHPQESEAPAPP
jgi:hypothetical protein